MMANVKPLSIKALPLDQLEAAPYNPRHISAEALAGLKASVKRFGLVEPIVWNKRTKHVVGGHQRIKALREMGHAEAQVVIVDLPAREEKALNLALNNPHIAGEFTDGVAEMVEEIGREAMELVEELRLDQLVDIDALFPKETIGETDPEPEPDRAEELREKWGTETGQIWGIGEHRVLCGDSNDPASRILVGAKDARVVIFDPEWDDMPPAIASESVLAFCDGATVGKITERYGDPTWVFAWDCVSSWYTPNRPLRRMKLCAWYGNVKDYDAHAWHYGEPGEERVVSNTRGSYKHTPDPRGKQLSDVFSAPITREHAEAEHSHSKPIDWICMLIGNCTKGDIYDPFLGSGTTIVAAQNLGRKAYGIEISPAYVAVTLDRLSKMGLEPRLVD